jgi:hypothetical protein
VTWQTRDMAKPLNLEALEEPRFIPGWTRGGKSCRRITDQIQVVAALPR